MAAKSALPSIVPFPEAAWRDHIVPEEWEACLDAWIALAGAHLSLSNSDFIRTSAKDESLPIFLTSYAAETALSHDTPSSGNLSKSKQLRKQVFLLSHRLLDLDYPPTPLLHWGFLADICKIYGRNHGNKAVVMVWKNHISPLEISMASLKASLIKELDAGLKGDLRTAEAELKRLNHLLHASPEAAAFFMAGSDFVDALISCYKLMNPPLRKVIISTIYLCLVGLTEGEKPNFSSLVDQLYSLKTAAETHKAGPTNVNDSLVAELVTVTPILKQAQQRLEASDSGSSRAKAVIKDLEGFRKPGGSGRPARLNKRKINKGKGVAIDDYGEVHIHRMSFISQVQDLFPDLGSGFVVKLLDEYGDDVEQVISHLLEGSLPAHLESADRSEALYVSLPDTTNMIRLMKCRKLSQQALEDPTLDLAPHSTPPQLPTRRNIFDDDEFDQLAISTSKLHFGRKNPDKTADEILQDRSTAPNKAAILSALAAFDSDDDERDDTYDIEDVGGTVDTANPEEANSDVRDAHDEVLFKAFKSSPGVFGRDAATRRGKERGVLREQTGMTDEAIEGWALMLSRDPRQMRRLEAKFSTFTGAQKELKTTRWGASPAESGTEESDVDGGNRGRGGGGYRGRGRGGRGNVAGLTGEKDTEVARQRKEANKGSRANHNRRDQRARKMARGGGGFPG
jgi:activating signal cointegrator complex subunit 2